MPSDVDRTAKAVDRVQPQRDALREAHHAFAAACESAADSVALADALTALRSAFDLHVEYAEGGGGLFEELLDDAPAEAAPEVDRLKRDHAVIATAMDRAAGLLGEGAGIDDERLAGVTAEVVRLLAQHRRRGAELLYNVYAVEIGAGD
ncbi:MAG: hypothetical protein WD271_02810 [Acidimicrobiia bacterium]